MSMSPPPDLSYEPRPMEAPKPGWGGRINFRIIVFVGVILLIAGVPIYMWLDEAFTGGIHDRGAYKEVDLKAMSLFDMDQYSATMKDIPEQFRQLEGKDVMMVGEMWQPHSAGGDTLSYFQLVYSKTKCCFSGPPLAQHFVDGNVVNGSSVYYFDVPVKVRGKLHVNIRKNDAGKIQSIYHVDVNSVEPIEQ